MGEPEKNRSIIRHNDPITAAMEVLNHYALRGSCSGLPEFVVRAMVAAVLASADTVAAVRTLEMREAWEEDRYRDHIRLDLRRRLLDSIVQDGRVPVALPVERVRHVNEPYSYSPIVDGELQLGGNWPTDEQLEQGWPWTHVEISLEVPVRTPPIDRAAAVRAGLL